MNVLMYPLGPDDDFPEEFCAIRQGSGEHRFYTPVGESESWTLYHAKAENDKLRELLADTLMQPRDYCQKYGIEYESWDSANDHLDARMRDLGIEVSG